MITVLFFAKLREDVGVARVELPYSNEMQSVHHVVSSLHAVYGEAMAEALAAENIIVAINHEVADFSAQVNEGDEIAFYPPVSGG
jgi:molybdopterin synthase sulfur carrier subunit